MEHVKKYLTCSEAAAVLRVTPRSIARFAREGKLPGMRVPGGKKILIPSEAVDSALRSAKKGGAE
jgi:excisionase family DNA binding protein